MNRKCPLHGIYCKQPHTVWERLAFYRAHADIPEHYFDPVNVPAQDPRTHRIGKTRQDHRSGAWAARLANRAKRAQQSAR